MITLSYPVGNSSWSYYICPFIVLAVYYLLELLTRGYSASVLVLYVDDIVLPCVQQRFFTAVRPYSSDSSEWYHLCR